MFGLANESLANGLCTYALSAARQGRNRLRPAAASHSTKPCAGRAPAAGAGAERRRAGTGKLYRARSRLYQNEILQENMRLTAFFQLYKMCTLLHRSKVNILTKIGSKNQQFSRNFSNFLIFQILQHLQKFAIF